MNTLTHAHLPISDIENMGHFIDNFVNLISCDYTDVLVDHDTISFVSCSQEEINDAFIEYKAGDYDNDILQQQISTHTHRINAAANTIRRIISNADATLLALYVDKVDEAMDYLSTSEEMRDGLISPLLQAESEAKSKPLLDVAQSIINKKKLWVAALAAIERIRYEGIKLISGVDNINDVEPISIETIDSLNNVTAP